MAIWNAPTTEIDPEALASTDMLYLAYTMARIRPVVPDLFVVQRLKDVQRIKGLTMDTVLLQFWLAGLTGLAESSTSSQRLLWKCLVLVKIPSIVSKLGCSYNEICNTVESTLQQLSFYRGILNECDDCIAEDGMTERADVLKSIAVGCRAKGLVRLDQLDILADIPPTSYDPEEYKFEKHSEQLPSEAIDALCGRTLIDFEHQEALLDRIIQVCEDAATNNDVLTLSKLCQTLDDNPLVVDLVLLMRPPSMLLVPLESFINNLQQNEDDDIDTCNSNLEGFGDVLILIMTIIRRYELAECLDSVLNEKQGFCYLWLHHTSATIPTASMSSMTADMQGLMGRWITALFDSMGISDDLIQTSKPQMLLEISPSIFEQSLAACQAGVIDATTLNGGLDYFLQPCLLFVLIGVVQYLCQEIVFSAPSPLNSTHHSAHGASSASSMMSPTGGAVSPVVSRGGAGGNSGGKLGHSSSSSGKSVVMLQSILKSLLAGEAFPARLIRLLKSEISAALSHHAIENDHQLAIIHERLADTSVNYDSWKISEAYDVPKLAQQTSFAYDAIISGGRTPLIMKREKGWPILGGSSYHIDVDLFRATLCYIGPAQFVTNILKRFLKAALTPNGRRAAELGAAMITTPLVGCGDKHLSPQSLIWTMMSQTIWIPVPGRLETFAQGKHLATFVGMTLDMFQSSTFVEHRQAQQQQQQQQNGVNSVSTAAAAAGGESMDVDSVQVSTESGSGSGSTNLLEQLERDAAVEPFRVMLDQRLKALEPIARDRPGFEGFVQGMAQYRERHPALSLPLQGGTGTASTTTTPLRKVVRMV
ncbi:mediator complex subunit [Linnemannia exigua]|uniref:Mediator of RNA polymerase II transcription subunit 5 n=1 Tax=Linnemannia exigua TaxID=604196 RepID=A0AAD4H7E8_9FUNG|nr:mediator complex subunit [Linnemannia exigua]